MPGAELIVANPTPLTFWRRDVLVRSERLFGNYESVPFLALKGQTPPQPTGMSDPRIGQRLPGNREAEAFLFWSRMPIAEVDGDTIVLRDQRFMGLTAGRFAVELEP